MASAGPQDADAHGKVWERKPTLRAIYRDFRDQLLKSCPPGLVLEVGAGTAHDKEQSGQLVTLDIRPGLGVDVVADAHALPFAAGTFDGIVMIDVLHHLQYPVKFLRGAARTLRKGGRLSMIEPGMSPLARPCYSRFHHEPVDMAADPFKDEFSQSSPDPWDSNQALPTLMFSEKTSRRKLMECVPELDVVSVEWLSMFAYPLSGGFKPWCLMPQRLVKPTLWAERTIFKSLSPLLGFRLQVTLERR